MNAQRKRTRICWEGWCYLLLVAFVFAWAVLLEVNLLLIVAGMLCGPLLLGWRGPARSLRRVQVRRRAAGTGHAGDVMPIDVEVRNGRKRTGSWALVVRDALYREGSPRRHALLAPTVFFARLPAGASARRTYRVHLPARGRYRLGPLELSTRYPFGLFRRTVTLDTGDVLTVFPKLGRLTSAWSKHCHDVAEGTQGAGRSTRAPGEFFEVRPWESGDSVRWVHWRSTARHGQLVVRQFEQMRGRDTAVLVDLWQPAEPNDDDRKRVELAVSFAATVVADLCRRRQGHLMVSVEGAEPTVVSGPTSDALAGAVLGKLAVARATSHASFSPGFERSAEQVRPTAAVLLVGTQGGRLGQFRNLAAMRAGRAAAVAAGRTYTISTDDPRFSDYFQLE